ncbi:MAG: GGDEF domain-containing protein [Pseudomonadales bacterium]|nr:GGDEF domain-containing protein [Pseudomonadales bacterium]
MSSRQGISSLDFRGRANLGLAVACLLILGSFAINNLVQGRVLLGLGSLLICTAMIAIGWLIYNRRDPGLISLLVIVPAVIGFLYVSIQNQGIIGVLWCYPGILAFFIMLKERVAPLAALAMILVVVPQAWNELGSGIGLRAGATLAAVTVFTSIFMFSIMEAQERLQQLAITDSLTGLNNRVMLHDALNRALQQFLRSKTPMTLLAIDIDHFKAVNDQLGHAVGDEVLSALGELLRGRFRKVDQIFRLGGEEFLVLLNDTGGAEAAQTAEDLRALVEVQHMLDSRPVTVSIGVASLVEDGNVGYVAASIGFAHYPFNAANPRMLTWERVVALADRAAYVSKRNGGNAWTSFVATEQAGETDVILLRDLPSKVLSFGKIELFTSIEGALDVDSARPKDA